jgi:predicted nucleotidyltransferase
MLMLLTRPFEVVTPTVDGDVLQVLAGAESWFTVGQIHELVGAHSYNGVKKALLRLVRQGIVITERAGTVNIYRLNPDHLAAPAVLELANLPGLFLERLRAALNEWPHPPVFAALFGSAGRGDMRPDSDVDLFLVRPDHLNTAVDALARWDRDANLLQRDATAWTGNDTRILEMSEAEVHARLASEDPVLTSIRTEGRILHGDRAFWRRVRRG